MPVLTAPMCPEQWGVQGHIRVTAGLPGDSSVLRVSDMRKSAQVLVLVDVARAIQTGVPFYKSDNNVALTPEVGEAGLLPCSYFSSAVDTRTGAALWHASEIRPRLLEALLQSAGGTSCLVATWRDSEPVSIVVTDSPLGLRKTRICAFSKSNEHDASSLQSQMSGHGGCM